MGSNRAPQINTVNDLTQKLLDNFIFGICADQIEGGPLSSALDQAGIIVRGPNAYGGWISI